jgi:hypothetical protein
MSLDSTILLTARLVASMMFLHALEMFVISRRQNFLKIWNIENLKNELKFTHLFSVSIFKVITVLQLVSSLFAIITLHPVFFLLILLTNFYFSLRFLGTFNGGSDMMSVVVLTGTLISLSSSTLQGQKLGLIYIAIHAGYSYFKAGWAKIMEIDWRNGSALPVFLKRSLDPKVANIKLSKTLSLILCWFVIIFELSAILLPLIPSLLWPYFIMAILFHLIIYFTLGLNRFFWIWLNSWPAIFYSISLLPQEIF